MEIFRVDPVKFFDANKDYLQRMERDGLFAAYDSALDTLFIEVGKTREAITDPFADNVMVRIDPETLEIVGLEIHDFLDDFLPANRLVREMTAGWMPNRNEDYEWTVLEPGIEELMRTIMSQLALSRD